MPEYLEHPSKLARSQGGRYVGSPEAEEADCTVWFAFEPDRWEGLLARRLAQSRAQVCAIPAFVYDVNLGDEVATVESAEGALVAARVVHDAGKFTFRAWLPESGRLSRQTLMVEMERFSCWFDAYSAKLIAISAEADDAEAVGAYLASRESAGELVFETGRTGPRSTA